MAESSENKNKRKNGGGKIISRRIFAALLIVFLVSGGLFLHDFLTYKKGESDYAAVNAAITVEEAPEAAEAAGTTENAAAADDEAGEQDEAEEYPALAVDFDKLGKTNADFVGVLYIPALDLYYPVAHSHDNAEYLRRTFSGEQNPCGSIFLDKAASADFSDLNTFIFGHNMKNGTMFGSLKRFSREEGLCDADPYIYLYTKDAVRKYHIFSYSVCSVNDDLYRNISGKDGYGPYVKHAQNLSEYRPETDTYKDDFSQYPPILTLSTCYGTAHTQNFVVFGALTGIYENSH